MYISLMSSYTSLGGKPEDKNLKKDINTMLPHFILKLKLQMSVVQAGSGQLHAMGYITRRKKELQVPTQ